MCVCVCSIQNIIRFLKRRVFTETSPMTKHMVAVIGITAQISPMDGLYTASAVPTMNPPPTHVAVSQTQTEDSSRKISFE